MSSLLALVMGACSAEIGGRDGAGGNASSLHTTRPMEAPDQAQARGSAWHLEATIERAASASAEPIEGSYAPRVVTPTEVTLHNAAHHFEARATKDGVLVTHSARDSHTTTLHGATLGCEGAEAPLALGDPGASGSEVRYRRGAVDEWVQNGENGLEHGFSLSERPSCDGPKRLAVRFDGTLSARLHDPDGDGRGGVVDLVDDQGHASLRYGELHVYDANGRALASSMGVEGGQVVLHFVDDGASYPVTIDPLLWEIDTTIARGINIVAFEGDLAASSVGSPPSSVDTFARTAGGWVTAKGLPQGDPQAGDNFASSLGISSTTLIAGAKGHTVNAIQPGAAYVFRFLNEAWTQEALLTASDGADVDAYGASVAISGDTAVVGAPLDDDKGSDSGSVYVYTRTNGVWSQQAKLLASDGVAGNHFGAHVAIQGDSLVASTENGKKSAYVFVRVDGVWSQQSKLVPIDVPPAVAGYTWGNGLAISNDTIAVADSSGNASTGAAYVFVRSGASWSQQAKLVASNGAPSARFGDGIALEADRIMMGAPNRACAAGNGCGMLYVYERVGGLWSEVQSYAPANIAAFGYFGWGVSLSGTTAIVGGQKTTVMHYGSAHGTACATSAECASNHCVDGYCCDGTCGGACDACNAADLGWSGGVNGTCMNAPNGQGYVGSPACGNAYLCSGGANCPINCKGDADCAASFYCAANGTCLIRKSQGSPCLPLPGADCKTLNCNVCASGFCADGFCCDSTCGACLGCSKALSGLANGTCGPIAPQLTPKDDCKIDPFAVCGNIGTCDGNGLCALQTQGVSCGTPSCSNAIVTTSACDGSGICSPSSAPCDPYQCAGNACGTTCASDANCTSNAWCDATQRCQAKGGVGVACAGAHECASGFCTDGVCCDTTCSGACQACSAAKKGSGTDGTCGAVAVGTDPDGDCPDDGPATCNRDGACSGLGTCRLYSVGTSCGALSCAGSTVKSNICDGLGACGVSPVVVDCAPYSCAAGVCLNTCASDGECSSGNFCSGGSCVPKLANGAACASSGACLTGFCVEGLCCDSACNGKCQACAAKNQQSALDGGAPLDGTCGLAMAGTDPHDDCPDDGAGSCQRNGMCDGTGVCGFYAAKTSCAPSACSGAAKIDYACSGLGACLFSSTDCGAQACKAGACTSGCADDTDCASSSYCNAGVCMPRTKAGASCKTSAECETTFCVDGYCCNTPCDGQCEACDVVKAEGICIPVSGEPHGSVRAACNAGADAGDADAGDGLCAKSACNGVERLSCAGYVGQGVRCREPSCTDGVVTFAGYCDGLGSCPAATVADTKACAPFVCGGQACAESCASDADCVDGATCDTVAMKCILGATCTDDHTAGIAGSTPKDCTPFRCAAGQCLTQCNSIDDCAAPNVCDVNRLCVPPTGFGVSRVGASCAMTNSHASSSESGAWLMSFSLLGLVLVRRRGRSSQDARPMR